MKKDRPSHPNIVIGGYYGYGSMGDDAVLRSILEGISKRMTGASVTVLSADRSALPSFDNISVKGASRTNPLTLASILLRSDIFISGGGTLLQDTTSKRSLLYYTFLIRLAKLCRSKIYIYANGIGPLSAPTKLQSVLRLADRISVRDPDSLLLVKKICKKNAHVRLTADPVFTCPVNKNTRSKALVPDRPYFVVSLRQCSAGRIDEEKLVKVVKACKEKGLLPVFVSMQDSYDRDVCEKASLKTEGKVANVKSIDELFCLLEGARFAIGMRLHFLLCALMSGIPTVALSYDTKVKSCVSYLGSPYILDAFNFSVSDVLLTVDAATADHNTLKRTKANCDRMKVLATNDMDELTALLFKNDTETVERGRTREKFFADT